MAAKRTESAVEMPLFSRHANHVECRMDACLVSFCLNSERCAGRGRHHLVITQLIHAFNKIDSTVEYVALHAINITQGSVTAFSGLMDWLTGKLADWLIDWLIDWLTNWLFWGCELLSQLCCESSANLCISDTSRGSVTKGCAVLQPPQDLGHFRLRGRPQWLGQYEAKTLAQWPINQAIASSDSHQVMDLQSEAFADPI